MRLLLAALALQLSACAALAPGPAAPPPAAAAPAGVAAPPSPSPSPFPSGSAPAPAPIPVAGSASSAAAGPGAARPPASAAAAPGAPGAPPPPPPFATVVKDAKRVDGLFAFWQQEERLWVELRPEDFGRPFFLSPKLASGIGEPPAWGGQMLDGSGGAGGPQVVEFRRQYRTVQLLARNTEVMAAAGTAAARGLDSAFSPSLLGSAPVASQPHPESQAVLVEVTGIFVSDLPGIGARLQRAYRQGYALDGRNSAITGLRAGPDQVVIEVRSHYATASLAQAQPGAPPGTPAPGQPRFLPDARSLFVGLHYSLSRLPVQPMAPRRADPRVGYFEAVVRDLGDDQARDPRQRHIARWRLEKQDPSAALSKPVRPITFWLDRSIPERYRATIRDGALAWNAAFERAGFEQAIVVEQQPDDAAFDTLDSDRASIRWLSNARIGFSAIGPSHVDPRSGEILDADVAIEGLATRAQRSLRRQVLQGAAGEGLPHVHDSATCTHAEHAAEQFGYAMDVMQAQGLLEPDSPQAEAFVLQYLRWLTMHEVGHALGLRHNFRGSAAYAPSELADAAFTRAFGTTASVMDYPAVNLPAPGRAIDDPFPQTLGPYDLWAIEYGYTPPAPGSDSAAQSQALEAIAARGARDARLAYATDEDVVIGLDPEALQFDLGADPLAFARQRFEIARDVLRRQAVLQLPADQDYARLRRSIGYAVRDAGRAAFIAARQIGGLRTLRDYPGSGRDPLQPVPAARQREALELIAREALAADSLVVPAALQRRLAPDFLERGDALFGGEGAVSTDYSVSQMVLDTQRSVLGQLMSDEVAARVLDNTAKLDRPREAFTLDELYSRLTREVWSELGRGIEIPAPRRELQREHLNRLTALLLRPSALSRADARGLARVEARQLLSRLDAAQRRATGLSAQTRAHLADASQSLQLALAAPLLRGSP